LWLHLTFFFGCRASSCRVHVFLGIGLCHRKSTRQCPANRRYQNDPHYDLRSGDSTKQAGPTSVPCCHRRLKLAVNDIRAGSEPEVILVNTDCWSSLKRDAAGLSVQVGFGPLFAGPALDGTRLCPRAGAVLTGRGGGAGATCIARWRGHRAWTCTHRAWMRCRRANLPGSVCCRAIRPGR
jgi:hypothetical protein